MNDKRNTLKKRILPLILTLCTIFSMAPSAVLPVYAQPTYSVEAALAYAANHWNDGKGLCAEFACDVLNAGGLNMKMEKRVINCLKAAEKASGLTRTKLKLTPLKDYKGKTSEMATYELDGDILAAGDLVVQWCFTHNIGPHALICAGYDSEGYAVYYAHNGNMNKKRFQLGNSLAYEHDHNCDMGAYVLHVSGLDPAYSSAEEPAEQKHVHTYNSVGRCTDCGTEYSLSYTSISKEAFINVSSVTLKVRPYADAADAGTCSFGERVTATAHGENAFGDPWYRVSGSCWVPESALTFTDPVANKTETQAQKTTYPANEPEKETAIIIPDFTIEVNAASQITDTTAHINGSCSYSSGYKPSSVGIRLGTSKNSLHVELSDVINHNKNPFDIWYDLDGLTPGTTYYYSLYAVYNGETTETPVTSFTTKATQNSSSSANTSSQNSSSLTSTVSTAINNTAFSSAGWRLDSFGWWYDNGNGTWPANGWQWIDGNGDGIAECYYFNIFGYILVNTLTPDGYWVNSDGAWVQDNIVQIR